MHQNGFYVIKFMKTSFGTHDLCLHIQPIKIEEEKCLSVFGGV